MLTALLGCLLLSTQTKLEVAYVIDIILRIFVDIRRHFDHLGDLDVDGRIILRWIFGMWEGWRLDGVGSG